MKKTDFLKNSPSYILPTIKYVISEPHGDLLHWNLSCSLTFDFLVHQEGGGLQSQCFPPAVPNFVEKIRKYFKANIYIHSLVLISFLLPPNMIIMIIKFWDLK